MKKIIILNLLIWMHFMIWMTMDVTAHTVPACFDSYSNAQIPFERISYSLHSGMYSASNIQEKPLQVYQAIIHQADAQWLRLHFDDHNLGRRSYLTIISLLDGERQYFNASSLKNWHNSSAYFNGDAVEIKLFVVSGDKNIFLQMDKITFGRHLSSGPTKSTEGGKTWKPREKLWREYI